MFDEYLLNKIHQYIWFNKIKKLNDEYLSDNYVINNFWNYRSYYGEYENIIWKIDRSDPPIEPIPNVKLPPRYFYSSGSNNPGGI